MKYIQPETCELAEGLLPKTTLDIFLAILTIRIIHLFFPLPGIKLGKDLSWVVIFCVSVEVLDLENFWLEIQARKRKKMFSGNQHLGKKGNFYMLY